MADSAYKGPLCQARNRRGELNPADDGKSGPPSGGAGPTPSSLRHVNLTLAPRKAGASRRKPTPARPCTVAGVVKSRTKRSDQAIALWRPSARMARMCRMDELRSMAEMFKNPLDHCGLLDAGDHPQRPAALPAGLDINGAPQYGLARRTSASTPSRSLRLAIR